MPADPRPPTLVNPFAGVPQPEPLLPRPRALLAMIVAVAALVATALAGAAVAAPGPSTWRFHYTLSNGSEQSIDLATEAQCLDWLDAKDREGWLAARCEEIPGADLPDTYLWLWVPADGGGIDSDVQPSSWIQRGIHFAEDCERKRAEETRYTTVCTQDPDPPAPLVEEYYLLVSDDGDRTFTAEAGPMPYESCRQLEDEARTAGRSVLCSTSPSFERDSSLDQFKDLCREPGSCVNEDTCVDPTVEPLLTCNLALPRCADLAEPQPGVNCEEPSESDPAQYIHVRKGPFGPYRLGPFTARQCETALADLIYRGATEVVCTFDPDPPADEVLPEREIVRIPVPQYSAVYTVDGTVLSGTPTTLEDCENQVAALREEGFTDATCVARRWVRPVPVVG